MLRLLQKSSFSNRIRGPYQVRRKTTKVLALSIVLITGIAAQPSIPVITDPITDFTNTLTGEQHSLLRRQAIQFEDSTSNQIAVLLIPSLNGDEIREYGIQVLEKNKIGQKGKDNGVLLLIALNDKQISIEVGYGLEGVLTDAVCSDIIRNEIRPRFREGDFFGGISAAMQSIMLATKGEYTGNGGRKRTSSSWFATIVMFIIIMSFASLMGRRRRYAVSSRGMNSVWWWGGFGGGGGGGDWGSFGGGGGGGGWSAGGGSFGGGGASGGW